MTDHLQPLTIKAAMVAGVTLLVLPTLSAVTWLEAIGTGLVLTVVAYLAGDLGILPPWGNTAATIGDVMIAFGVIWTVPLLAGTTGVAASTAAIAAALIGLGEFYFHEYLQNREGVY